MEKLPIIADVKDLGKIVEARGDFYNELKQLEYNQARLISPRDEAYARLQTRGNENIGEGNGTWTAAGFEYIKEELPILRLKSRLNNLDLAKLAVKANKNSRYFCTQSQEEYKKSLKQAEKDKNKDPIDRNVIILPSRDTFTISDKENWDVYEFALKDQAKPYFELNGPIDVRPVDKNIVDFQEGTLLTQLWFWNLDYRSVFNGYNVDLGNVSWARGVRNGGEATQKISSYSIADLNVAKHNLEFLRGILQPDKLKGLEDFFLKLE